MSTFNYIKLQPRIQEEYDKIWLDIHNELKNDVGLVAYKSWLARLKILGFTVKGELFLSLPTDFLKDWVVNHYQKKIEKLCNKYYQRVKKIEILVKSNEDFVPLKDLQREESIICESSSFLSLVL